MMLFQDTDMNKDRFVQIIAVLVAVASMASATLLVPTINRQRREAELTFDLQRGDDLPPKYALASAMLGSFRGVAVDALWYRIERLKQQGKLGEANTLAQWITVLQPRFPQVWSFQAWNLAYNISVKTNTPAERYDWVNKGVRLLREQGIPNNPTTVRLYRELAWIFFHKMGKTADDMHWFYKRRMAEEWQEVLGAPNEGATTKEVLERFEPVAVAADKYFVLKRLTRVARDELDRVADAIPEFEADLRKVRDLPVVRVEDVLKSLHIQYDKKRSDLTDQLQGLEGLIAEQTQRENLDKLQLLYQDSPETKLVVDRLNEVGLGRNEDTMRKFGQMIIAYRYNDPKRVVTMPDIVNDPQLYAVAKMMFNPTPEMSKGLTDFLAFLRAKVLFDRYKMDPGVMYELMELYGPLDWRHPAAHAVYWGFLGVRVAGELSDTTHIDLVNTDRNVVQGLQELTDFGKVSYDPVLRIVNLLPDPRFIPSYEKAVMKSMGVQSEADFARKDGVIKNFKSGHSNFLVKAIVYSYLYGDVEQAKYYFDKMRRLYGDEDVNARTGRLNMPLPDFVMSELKQDMDMSAQVIQFIDAMLGNALKQGLANGRRDVFAKFVRMAEVAYNEYSKDKLLDPKAERARQKLGSFKDVFVNAYANYLKSPGLPIIMKVKIYRNTPVYYREWAYREFRDMLKRQCEMQGVNFAMAFPAPPSIAKEQLVAPDGSEDDARSAETIERQ